MQTMHDTIARLKLAGCAPDVTVEIARDACGYHEFWRAQELIALGRERAALALANAMADRIGNFASVNERWGVSAAP